MSQLPNIREDVLSREVEDELLLYDPKSGETLLLNASAAVIADLCDGEHDADAIAQSILEALPDADGDLVRADVKKTIDELRDKGMLVSTTPAA
jgi:PqqD family protein of HPr-rel-A system